MTGKLHERFWPLRGMSGYRRSAARFAVEAWPSVVLGVSLWHFANVPPENTDEFGALPFADEFLARGPLLPIRRGGIVVRSTAVFTDILGGSATIEFLQDNGPVSQGLQLAISAGNLEVEGARSRRMVLWTATAPQQVTLRLTNRKPTRLTLRNTWAGRSDLRPEPWSGLQVEELGDAEWLLRCSCGFIAPRFDDLVARLKLESGRLDKG